MNDSTVVRGEREDMVMVDEASEPTAKLGYGVKKPNRAIAFLKKIW